jgi:hypothetical protein
MYRVRDGDSVQHGVNLYMCMCDQKIMESGRMTNWDEPLKKKDHVAPKPCYLINHMVIHLGDTPATYVAEAWHPGSLLQCMYAQKGDLCGIISRYCLLKAGHKSEGLVGDPYWERKRLIYTAIQRVRMRQLGGSLWNHTSCLFARVNAKARTTIELHFTHTGGTN